MAKTLTLANAKWLIYIPEEGHWPIAYRGNDEEAARVSYLKRAKRKRLPPHSFICRSDGGMIEHRAIAEREQVAIDRSRRKRS